MKIAIMQPYFFPYMGYFQLITQADSFIFLDNVNHIKRGWIHRNKILINSKPSWIGLSLVKASQNRKISDTEITQNGENHSKILKTIVINYSKASYFEEVFPLVKEIFSSNHTNLSEFLIFSIKSICSALAIPTLFSKSSESPEFDLLKGEQKIIALCKKQQAEIYINPPGGKELYTKEKFDIENIELKFLEPSLLPYKQFEVDFTSHLSIIDVMMHNGIQETKRLVGGRS